MSWKLALALGALAACRNSTREFRARLEPPVVAFLCDHDRPADQLPSLYRKCFAVDEAQCRAVMQRKVHACAARIIRAPVDENNAGNLAVRVGECAGADYETELEGKRIHSHACDIARDAYAKARVLQP